MKRLAIIGAGRAACDYAVCARAMGVETHCFAWEEGAIAKEEVDFFHPVSIFDEDRLEELFSSLGMNGVVPTTELTIQVAAHLAKRFGLPGNPPSVAERITDKARNRGVSEEVDGFTPIWHMSLPSGESVPVVPQFPVIVKPVAEGGKRGVSVARDEAELLEAIRYAISDSRDGGGLVVEQFIEGGVECSVESLSSKGSHWVVQVTEKVSSGAPHCVELGHHQPAALSPAMREKVERSVCALLTALGIESGPCHTEIKVRGNDIYLIEVNARPGGDLISHPLVLLSTGYSYLQGAIRIALDEFDGVPPLKGRSAGILFVTEQTGWLESLFKCCQEKKWFFRKNQVSDGLTTLRHNDSAGTNYFVYCTDGPRPDFAVEAAAAARDFTHGEG